VGIKNVIHRLIATGWICYVVGIMAAIKRLPIEMSITEYTIWDKIQVIFVFMVTIFIGYMAGKEAQK